MNHGRGGLGAAGPGCKDDEPESPLGRSSDLDGECERERGEELWLVSMAKKSDSASSLGIAGGRIKDKLVW